LGFAVEVVDLVGGGQVEQALIDVEVDGMLLEDFQYGDVAFVGAGEQLAEVAEGLLRLVVQGVVDVLEVLGDVEVVDVGAELQPEEVTIMEGLVGLEGLSREDILLQDDVEVGFQGLQPTIKQQQPAFLAHTPIYYMDSSASTFLAPANTVKNTQESPALPAGAANTSTTEPVHLLTPSATHSTQTEIVLAVSPDSL
jgi:hypothetical protein